MRRTGSRPSSSTRLTVTGGMTWRGSTLWTLYVTQVGLSYPALSLLWTHGALCCFLRLQVHAPAVFWGGWYDIFLHGNLGKQSCLLGAAAVLLCSTPLAHTSMPRRATAAYWGYQYASLPQAQGKSHIVIDPCGHCQGKQCFPMYSCRFAKKLKCFCVCYDQTRATTLPRTSSTVCGRSCPALLSAMTHAFCLSVLCCCWLFCTCCRTHLAANLAQLRSVPR